MPTAEEIASDIQKMNEIANKVSTLGDLEKLSKEELEFLIRMEQFLLNYKENPNN